MSAYTKTLLHEFTHLFLFKNKKFQNIMREEWENKYKDIKPNTFRNNIEEIIVNNIINGNRDYGYLYNDLNIKNDNEKESEILLSNKFKRSTYDFLDKLKNGNSLENELPIFIEKITDLGIFK